MILIQHNEPLAERRDLFVQMVDVADYLTPKTGLALTIEIVKSGSAGYASASAAVTEVGAGTYRVRLGPADVDMLGAAMLKISAEGAATQYVPVQVVRFPDEIHLTKAALVNARSHTIETGVDVIKDDDGATVLRTLTPTESNGVVTIAAS